jgi:hypothetical protein
MSSPPSARYARSGDSRIAHEIVEHGPIYLVFISDLVSDVDLV